MTTTSFSGQIQATDERLAVRSGVSAAPPRAEEYTDGTVIRALTLLALGIVALSVFFFSNQSLRLDESQSLWQTSHSMLTIFTIVSEDVHVPLYHVLLHYWQFFFGNDAAVGRMLSLIFYLLMIPAIYVLGNKAYNSKVGLYAAVLTAVSPFLNWYGNEIRMYSLFALMTIVNQYFFISLMRVKREEDGTVRAAFWVGYGVTLILGMFTHYFFAFGVITQVIFYFLYRQQFPRKSLLRFATVFAVSALLFLPWLYFVFTHGSASNTQPLLAKPTSIDVFNTFSQFIFGFQNDHTNTLLVSAWPLLVLLVFLAVRSREKISPSTMYLFFSLFMPIALAFAVSVEVKPIYLTRYLILTLPALYLLMSWVLSIYPARLARFMKTAIVIGMVVTMGVEIVNASTPVKENYRSASDYLSAHASPSDVIVLSAPFTVYPFEYYYHGNADIETLPVWDQYAAGPIPEFKTATLPAEVAALKDSHQTLWLLLSYNQGYENDIRMYFDTHFERTDARNFSVGLDLYAYKLRYDNESLAKVLQEITNGSVQAPHPSNLSTSSAHLAPTPDNASSQSTSTQTTTPLFEGSSSESSIITF